MPIGTLPPSLVKRLRTAAKKGNRPHPNSFSTNTGRFVKRLRNIDHRNGTLEWPTTSTGMPGGRVRELSVKRNYPALIDVAIKRVHGEKTAHSTISFLRKLVDRHNARYKNVPYILKKPVAYALTDEFIAMRKVSFPAVIEVVGGAPWAKSSDRFPKTQRGVAFLSGLAQKHSTAGCNEEALVTAANELSKHTEALHFPINPTNILVTGFEKGKFVFVPLVDLF